MYTFVPNLIDTINNNHVINFNFYYTKLIFCFVLVVIRNKSNKLVKQDTLFWFMYLA
jgi:hypothetical protein